MRITFKVATAGERGLAQLPRMKEPGDAYVGANGVMDEARVRRELANTPGVQFSDRDNAATIAFAVEFLDRMRIAFCNLADSEPQNVSVKTGAIAKPTNSCERRMGSGRCAYVRTDIGIAHGAVRVALSYANPREIAGTSEEMAATLAQACADNLVAIREDLRSQGTPVAFVEGENAVGIFARAEERVRMHVLRVEMRGCERRHNGFCSPVKTDCPFYANGKCAYR